jgi:transcriptional antiterminator NusG
MDEQEPEERADEAPLQESAEQPEQAQAATVASARDLPVSEESLPAQEPSASLPESVPEAVAVPEEAAAEVEGVSVVAETAEVPAPPAAAPRPKSGSEAIAREAKGLREGRLPQGEVPAEGGTEPAWYVVHCYSGYENKVRHNLEQRIETMGMKDRIFDVVIPTQEEIEVREGKRRTVERHIFPGYVLVNMTLSEESWYVVRNTPGVTGFVGMGNLPTPLRPEEVAQIIKRMEAEAPAVKVSFKMGERVRIIDGPFNDFRGTVADIDMERTKVRVMVSFFGRETPVELDFLQVERA